MIPTRRAALAQSGNRFSLRQTRSVCAEIMLKLKKIMLKPESAYATAESAESDSMLSTSAAGRGGLNR
jgi:hypothetical protein